MCHAVQSSTMTTWLLFFIFFQVSKALQITSDASGDNHSIQERLELIETRITYNEDERRRQNEEILHLRQTILEQSIEIRKQKAKIQELDETVKEQTIGSRRQEEGLVQLRNIIKVQTEQMQKFKHLLPAQPEHDTSLLHQGGKMQLFSNVTSSLEGQIKDTSSEATDRQEKPYLEENGSTRKSKRLLVQNANINTGDTLVAFQAVLSSSLAHVGVNQNIKFEQVITNIGGGYNEHQGVFTAPEAGVYLLQTSVASWVGTSEVRTVIAVNGKPIVRLIAKASDGRHEQGSNIAIVHLQQGDDVTVRNIDLVDTSFLGAAYTSFSGVLLQQMA